MPTRRMVSSSRVRSPRSSSLSQRTRRSAGMTRSLHTIVESAIATTTTMAVADERPPMKASSARVFCPCVMGTVRT